VAVTVAVILDDISQAARFADYPIEMCANATTGDRSKRSWPTGARRCLRDRRDRQVRTGTTGPPEALAAE